MDEDVVELLALALVHGGHHHHALLGPHRITDADLAHKGVPLGQVVAALVGGLEQVEEVLDVCSQEMPCQAIQEFQLHLLPCFLGDEAYSRVFLRHSLTECPKLAQFADLKVIRPSYIPGLHACRVQHGGGHDRLIVGAGQHGRGAFQARLGHRIHQGL